VIIDSYRLFIFVIFVRPRQDDIYVIASYSLGNFVFDGFNDDHHVLLFLYFL